MDTGFSAFWSAYPRREAKKEAEKAWKKLTDSDRKQALEKLPAHVRYWADREKRYMPLPATWLNGARWEDEIEVVDVPKASSAWWTSEEATLAKARELGIVAQGGEDWTSFRKRIADRIRAAA